MVSKGKEVSFHLINAAETHQIPLTLTDQDGSADGQQVALGHQRAAAVRMLRKPGKYSLLCLQETYLGKVCSQSINVTFSP